MNEKTKGNIVLIVVFVITFIVVVGGYLITPTNVGGEGSSNSLKSLYDDAQAVVLDNLISPKSAEFPKFDSSFVKYNTSILEDLGKGIQLEYRVYDVNAYVDAMNAYGAMIRSVFKVQVCVYVDDYNSPKFGSKGIRKGIRNHTYSFLMSLENK